MAIWILNTDFDFGERNQGCQMVHFQTKNPNSGKFLAMTDVGILYGHLVYFMPIWYITYMVIRYIFSRFGMWYHEKSGNPEHNCQLYSIQVKANGLCFF
jgi:hypothetical protein